VTKIEMKALQYQSVPQGNDRQYVDTDGKFFVFSEQEAVARVERRLAERISPEAPSEAEQAAAGEADELAQPWALSLTPQQYLDKYPNGKHAAHAKAVIDRGEGSQ